MMFPETQARLGKLGSFLKDPDMSILRARRIISEPASIRNAMKEVGECGTYSEKTLDNLQTLFGRAKTVIGMHEGWISGCEAKTSTSSEKEKGE